MKQAAAAVGLVLATMTGAAQSNVRVSTAQFTSLARRCAPNIAPDTLQAIISQESAFHPYDISVNYPHRSARRLGYPEAAFELVSQPRTKLQAIHWTRWFIDHGYTVSVGLMQVNIEQAQGLGLHPAALFDPCVNLHAGAQILQQNFAGRKNNLDGLAEAFSLYNSGSVHNGLQNSYAAGVIAKAPTR